MIQKIKQWLFRTKPLTPSELYTREQVLHVMEEAKAIGYTDGKRDGLAIAREQATNSLREILWAQNNPKK